MELTRDHKPCDREEKRQVERAGGKVVDGRVNGDLGVSRALGDYDRRYGRKVCRGEKGREEERRRGGERRGETRRGGEKGRDEERREEPQLLCVMCCCCVVACGCACVQCAILNTNTQV